MPHTGRGLTFLVWIERAIAVPSAAHCECSRSCRVREDRLGMTPNIGYRRSARRTV